MKVSIEKYVIAVSLFLFLFSCQKYIAEISTTFIKNDYLGNFMII